MVSCPPLKWGGHMEGTSPHCPLGWTAEGMALASSSPFQLSLPLFASAGCLPRCGFVQLQQEKPLSLRYGRLSAQELAAQQQLILPL